MSLRTPLARVRGLGSARDGTHHWWMQRLTAVALVPVALWFVVSVIALAGAGHDDFVAWAGNPFNATVLLILIFATFYHAQLGLQVVVEDYVHNEWVKVPVLVLIAFAAIFLGIISAVAVLKMAFAG